LRPGGVKAGAECAGILAALDDAGRIEKDLGLGLVRRIADVEQAEKDRGPARRSGCFKVGRDVCRAERVEGVGGDAWRSYIGLLVIFRYALSVPIGAFVPDEDTAPNRRSAGPWHYTRLGIATGKE
jgi:hypothetical protein